jgi:hypothetical protein
VPPAGPSGADRTGWSHARPAAAGPTGSGVRAADSRGPAADARPSNSQPPGQRARSVPPAGRPETGRVHCPAARPFAPARASARRSRAGRDRPTSSPSRIGPAVMPRRSDTVAWAYAAVREEAPRSSSGSMSSTAAIVPVGRLARRRRVSGSAICATRAAWGGRCRAAPGTATDSPLRLVCGPPGWPRAQCRPIGAGCVSPTRGRGSPLARPLASRSPAPDAAGAVRSGHANRRRYVPSPDCLHETPGPSPKRPAGRPSTGGAFGSAGSGHVLTCSWHLAGGARGPHHVSRRFAPPRVSWADGILAGPLRAPG